MRSMLSSILTRVVPCGVRLLIAVIALLLVPSIARAQPAPTLPVFVFDVRAFYSGLGQDPITAAALGVAPTDLPNRGLGGMAGLHIYPIRSGGFAIGLGGEALLARGRSQPVAAEETPLGPPIEQQLRGLAGALSLNFGHRDGWSYLTAGMGPLEFPTFQDDTAPSEPPPRLMTLNYGGGARWFITSHVAFGFDIRFYITKPEVPFPPYPPRERNRLLIMSAGLSFK
jgi:hypothetical protein